MKLRYSREIRTALENRIPPVALESTIISHGMPWPANLETAQRLEAIVREAGAAPATIAIIEGEICIGLEEEDLRMLARSRKVKKASRRDIAYLLSKRLTAATTVAATMIAARMAGIRIFATGGIGGVHRNGESTLDISADLQEFSKSEIAVVSAGMKSILDLPRTMEYLETMGVPVLGYQTDELPAFYCRYSSIPLEQRVDSSAEAAAVISAQWDCGIGGGLIIANPIAKQDSMDRIEIDRYIETALSDAARLGVRGKAITPYLLDRIKELSGGESLEANKRLVESNARLAAEIAVEYQNIQSAL